MENRGLLEEQPDENWKRWEKLPARVKDALDQEEVNLVQRLFRWLWIPWATPCAERTEPESAFLCRLCETVFKTPQATKQVFHLRRFARSTVDWALV